MVEMCFYLSDILMYANEGLNGSSNRMGVTNLYQESTCYVWRYIHVVLELLPLSSFCRSLRGSMVIKGSSQICVCE